MVRILTLSSIRVLSGINRNPFISDFSRCSRFCVDQLTHTNYSPGVARLGYHLSRSLHEYEDLSNSYKYKQNVFAKKGIEKLIESLKFVELANNENETTLSYQILLTTSETE